MDLDILQAAIGGVSGVSSGCAVTAQGSPNNTVAVASGTVVVAGVAVVVSSGNVTMTAAHATLPRFDLITVNNAGTKAYTPGTAASNPVPPAVPANSVALAQIYVPANDNVINSTQIIDKRVIVPTPVSTGGWTTVQKSADTTRSNTVTLTDDPTLTFVVAVNKTYRIRGVARWSSLLASDFQYAFNGPASPTRLLIRCVDFSATTGAETPHFDNAYGSAHPVNSTANQENLVKWDAVLTNGANAGSFAFQWAQSTAVVENTIVRAGSYLEWAQVD